MNHPPEAGGTSPPILLLATLGGSSEPLAKSIAHYQPNRILFVASDESSRIVTEIRKLLIGKYDLDEGRYDIVSLSDSQNFEKCVAQLRERLTPKMTEWRNRSDGRHHTVADFTGGTKCMSAALVLVCRPWPDIEFLYVGGDSRNKDGLGTVTSGSERIISTANPWAKPGYQAIEDAGKAYNHHHYAAAAKLLQRQLGHADGKTNKEFRAASALLSGYDLWDRMEYTQAVGQFKTSNGLRNDLIVALQGFVATEELSAAVKTAISRLETLKAAVCQDSPNPSRELLEDLLANAYRRKEEDRFVDAMARMYRAVELTAQLRLWERFEILTNRVPATDLPDCLQRKYRLQEDTIKIGLQEAYHLLKHRGDALGNQFFELKWHEPKSPLSARNHSIAGHGYLPVSEKTTTNLWKGTLSLTGTAESEVFRFPRFKFS